MSDTQMTAEQLAALHERCFVTPRPWNADEFRDFLASPLCFLRCEAGGFVLGRAVAGEAELLTIAVAPEARRSGIGRRLMAAFDEGAKAAGAEQAFLEVAIDNAAARALYLGTGWAEAGKRRGYYHTPDGQSVDAVVMTRPLADGGRA